MRTHAQLFRDHPDGRVPLDELYAANTLTVCEWAGIDPGRARAWSERREARGDGWGSGLTAYEWDRLEAERAAREVRHSRQVNEGRNSGFKPGIGYTA